jgi:spermidine synthase
MRGDIARPDINRVLFLSAFVIATCGLVYELVAGALASYLLGNGVTQWSLIIGTYLSAMGVGSLLSKAIDRSLLTRFVEIELAVALLGGFEASMLFAGFVYTESFQVMLYGLVAAIGILVGLELPLLIRILERETTLKDLIARILFLDYIGALAASVAFPLFLLPRLGLIRTCLVFGLLNAVVALWTTYLFEAERPVLIRLRLLCVATLMILAAGLGGAGGLETRMEKDLFADPVVYREITRYQRLVVTHRDGDTRLFIDGALQFSTVDEYRYHESLVHPALSSVAEPRRVLILGGGDGLAVREVLRHPSVQEIVLVDLDPAITRLFTERDRLAKLNGRSLKDPRVVVVNEDAFAWLRTQEPGLFDAVIIDFPDPNNYGLGKLYTNHFYRLLAPHLAPGAAIGIQSTSPMWSPRAYWCIVRTLEYEGFIVRPYHAYVPSFGEWGFVMASLDPLPEFKELPENLRFLDGPTMAGLFHFSPDIDRMDGPVNRLDNQVLVRLYEQDWRTLELR